MNSTSESEKSDMRSVYSVNVGIYTAKRFSKACSSSLCIVDALERRLNDLLFDLIIESPRFSSNEEFKIMMDATLFHTFPFQLQASVESDQLTSYDRRTIDLYNFVTDQSAVVKVTISSEIEGLKLFWEEDFSVGRLDVGKWYILKRSFKKNYCVACFKLVRKFSLPLVQDGNIHHSTKE